MNALAQAVQRTFTPPREVSRNGMAFIQHAEGEAGTGKAMLVAYQDSKGVWTIGWGHTGSVTPGMMITVEQAAALLDRDLDTAENAVATLVKVPLNDNQFDALVSFAFNIGVEAFRTSTLLRVLNQGRYDLVAGEMARWNKITPKGQPPRVLDGLTNRRTLEAGLFLTTPVTMPIGLMGTVDASKRLGANDPRSIEPAVAFYGQEPSAPATGEASPAPATPTIITPVPNTPRPPVVLANEQPTAPAQGVAQSAAGKSTIAALVAGASGAVTSGYGMLQPLIDAWYRIERGTAGLGQWAKVAGVLCIVGALGATAWSLWQQHRKLSGRKL